MNATSLQQFLEQQVDESIATKQRLRQDRGLMTQVAAVTQACIAAFRAGNKVILAGNGGSAADAQHIAAEFVSRFNFDRPGLPSIALSTDTSMITAISNDYGYEQLFRRQIEANGKAGDVFIGISTSGRSKNVLLAVEECRRRGIVTVGLTGMNGKDLECCDYCIKVPSKETPRIQEAHILIGHAICAAVEEALFGVSIKDITPLKAVARP